MSDDIASTDKTEQETAAATEQPDATSPSVESTESEEKKQSPEINAAFAGVKKEARQKGFDDGLRQGVEDGYARARAELNQSPPPQQTVAQAPAVQQNTQDQAANIALDNRGRQIELEGCRNFDDFSSKIHSLRDQANREQRKGDDSLLKLMAVAISVGDHKTIYELASNEEARENILDLSPRRWEDKLKRLGGSLEKSTSGKKAEPPLKDIVVNPVTSSTKHLSDYDRRQNSLSEWN